MKKEFVKLSSLIVKPCIACLVSTIDIICKVKDDFPELAAKAWQAGRLPYGSVDGFTKAFLVTDLLKALGNPECMVCGFDPACPMSALSWIFGDDNSVRPDKFCKIEDRTDFGTKPRSWARSSPRGLHKLQMM